MKVGPHAYSSLVALGPRMPVPASVVIARLKAMPASTRSIAIEVCRLQYAVGDSLSSNGDSVIVIARDGMARTAMLRRSWNQPFTAAALRVDEVQTWEGTT
jgi:hypothetical protein